MPCIKIYKKDFETKKRQKKLYKAGLFYEFMIFYSLVSILENKFGITDFDSFLVNIFFAAILFLVGIILGKLVGFLLKKALEKARIEKTKHGFFELFVVVIKWSIYIIFITLALEQLGIPEFTSWLTSILVVIPALVGALILIGVGFAIASYLKEVIEDSKIEGWKTLSIIFYFFILYVFMVFAFKTAFISFDKNTVNILVIILSTITAAAVAYWYIKQK